MFADISLSTETTVVVSGIIVALAAAIVFLFFMVVANLNSRISAITDDRKNWQNIAGEAVSNLEAVAVKLKPADVVPPIVPVVPEHSSPVSEAQQLAADSQTMRARLVAATLALGLPARKVENGI